MLPPRGLDASIRELVGAEIERAYRSIAGKQERSDALFALKERVRAALGAGAAPGNGASGNGSSDGGRPAPRYDDATLTMAWKVGAAGHALFQGEDTMAWGAAAWACPARTGASTCLPPESNGAQPPGSLPRTQTPCPA